MTKAIFLIAILFPAFAQAADLVGATDRDLQITIQELRGVKPSTKENLYVKVTVQRKEKNFEVFCDRNGTVTGRGSVNALQCIVNAETVSNDDDETLLFQITMVTNEDGEVATSVEDIEYAGDGTFLGESVEILSGRSPLFPGLPRMVIGLHPTRITEIPAFKLGQRMITALKPLAALKATIPVRRADLQVPIKKIGFDIAANMETNVGVSLDDSEFQNVRIVTPDSYIFSILKTPKKLDSGPRTATSIRNAVISNYDLR